VATRDGCLVPAEPFAELVRDHVSSWNLGRPQPGGQFFFEGSPPVRALAWLAAEASRHATGDGRIPGSEPVTEGMLEGLLDRGARQRDLISLRLADAIATALGRPEIFYDPRVDGRIVPNPAASREARQACVEMLSDDVPDDEPWPCCGGSASERVAA
jgi:hypothetical protein